MRFLEAWEQAEQGDIVKIKVAEGYYHSHRKADSANDDSIPVPLILSDKWEIEKTKQPKEHKITIHQVKWFKSKGGKWFKSKGGWVIYPVKDSSSVEYFEWEELLNKPPMEMSLRWLE